MYTVAGRSNDSGADGGGSGRATVSIVSVGCPSGYGGGSTTHCENRALSLRLTGVMVQMGAIIETKETGTSSL